MDASEGYKSNEYFVRALQALTRLCRFANWHAHVANVRFSAPFTIQRLCEMLLPGRTALSEDKRQYSRVDDYLYAIDRVLSVTTPCTDRSLIGPATHGNDSLRPEAQSSSASQGSSSAMDCDPQN